MPRGDRIRVLQRATGIPLFLFALVLLWGFAPAGATQHEDLACRVIPPPVWLAELEAAVQRGEISDPATRSLPEVSPGASRGTEEPFPCVTAGHIFPYEDTAELLLTNFSLGELYDLMTEAANAMLAAQGDNYDFVGFFLNFQPHHEVNAAFYLPVENDALGLGDPSGDGTPIFDRREEMGLAGENVEGYVMMWRYGSWQPGSLPAADFTRLVLAHEFEHRFATFLPNLADGRKMQGEDNACGGKFHWNWKVDGQGSAMEISEWVGENPATPEGLDVSFNTDTGGVFSYTDLYLMGYVFPGEMDAGNSELRYMEDSNCSSPYTGFISDFSSSEIIAAAGPRIPSSLESQKHFRTGWIMLHRPGDPPSDFERNWVAGILEQGQIDWHAGTLGRGTMNHTLFDDCNCNGIPDREDINGGGSPDDDGNGIPDECPPCFDETDSDGDGVGDLCDNCATVANPGQGDIDDEAIGDHCDLEDGLIYVRFATPNRLEWDEESGFDEWNAYRGDLEILEATGEYTQFPGSNPLAARFCGLQNPIAIELDSPGPGATAFYLVTGIANGEESDPGLPGLPRPNTSPCP